MKPPEPRPAKFELRLTEDEKSLYQRAADKEGRSIDGWMRDRLQRIAKEELEEGGAKGRKRHGFSPRKELR